MAEFYAVLVTPRPWYDMQGSAGYEYDVTVKRSSDGMEIKKSFSYRWTARRFAQSSRRLAKAFKRAERALATPQPGDTEHFIVEGED